MISISNDYGDEIISLPIEMRRDDPGREIISLTIEMRRDDPGREIISLTIEDTQNRAGYSFCYYPIMELLTIVIDKVIDNSNLS